MFVYSKILTDPTPTGGGGSGSSEIQVARNGTNVVNATRLNFTGSEFSITAAGTTAIIDVNVSYQTVDEVFSPSVQNQSVYTLSQDAESIVEVDINSAGGYDFTFTAPRTVAINIPSLSFDLDTTDEVKVTYLRRA